MDPQPHRQLVIVGGGILGLMAAHEAYERGFRDITVYETLGRHNLEADTFRNHSWFQSGLLYSDRLAAKILSEWGKQMLDKFNVDIGNERGVFRCGDDRDSEDELRERAEYLLISDKIRRLGNNEAQLVLGPFFKRGFIHYWLPDVPFEEAYLMYQARSRAKARKIHFRKGMVRIKRDGGSQPGFLIEVEGRQTLKAQYVVLCAGAGLLSLLNQLQVAHPLAVFRSALLRIGQGAGMRTNLMVDISNDRPTSGLSVIQHSKAAIPPNGCFVVGSRRREPVQPHELQGERFVTPDEDEDLQRLVPEELLPSSRNPIMRVIAGYKTEACDAAGKSTVRPWFGEWPDYPHLVASVPGKATQALYVAEQILDRLLADGPPPQSVSMSPPPGEESNYPPRPHHHQCFNGQLDERKDPNG